MAEILARLAVDDDLALAVIGEVDGDDRGVRSTGRGFALGWGRLPIGPVASPTSIVAQEARTAGLAVSEEATREGDREKRKERSERHDPERSSWRVPSSRDDGDQVSSEAGERSKH